MPTFNTQQLEEITRRILQGAGASAEEAQTVAVELAGANLVGHDSHGIMRLKQYVDYIEQGHIRPSAPVKLDVDTPTLAVLDGGGNFGQVVATKALQIATTRAREAGSCTVLCRECNHIGRLGSYTYQAALKGFFTVMAVNAPGPGGVVPWGGLDRKLGTNPISMAAPWNDEAIVLDMTTSATAEGKVRVALQKGESIPDGWVIDNAGNPTNNPADLYGDPDKGIAPGAILPLGGPLGFKGYGMSVMLDIVCGILSGAGIARTDVPPGTNGVWMYLIDVEKLMSAELYATVIGQYVDYIKSSRKIPGVDEILMPGEIELRRQAERRRDGITIPDMTWQQTLDQATRVGATIDGI